MSDVAKKALRDALASYLGTALASFPQGAPVVSGEWPTPGVALPPLAITVLAPGEPVTEYHPTQVHSVTPLAPPNGSVLYTYGHIEQGLQIDCWAQYREVRDLLAAAVEAALNVPPAVSLGLTSLPSFSRRGGLALALPTYFNVIGNYRMQAQPQVAETSGGAQGADWRATWIGTASTYLCNQEVVPLMKQLSFNLDGITPLSGPGSSP